MVHFCCRRFVAGPTSAQFFTCWHHCFHSRRCARIYLFCVHSLNQIKKNFPVNIFVSLSCFAHGLIRLMVSFEHFAYGKYGNHSSDAKNHFLRLNVAKLYANCVAGTIIFSRSHECSMLAPTWQALYFYASIYCISVLRLLCASSWYSNNWTMKAFATTHLQLEHIILGVAWIWC